jgi:dipeptidyl aminopeptidase/acylaminoacyl peptidase
MEAGEAKIFVVHGLLDPAIGIGNAQDLVDRAEFVGIHHEQLLFPTAGHAILNSHYEVIIPASVDFFYRNVIL